jgi:O-antigen/teichoic acid export membrane protein
MMANQVLLTPLFVATWGANLYGVWLSISALVSALAYADIGVTAYVMPRLMQSYLANDWSKLDDDMHSATVTILGIVGLAVLIGAATSSVLMLRGEDLGLLWIGVLLAVQCLLLVVQSFIGMPYSVVGRPQRAFANGTIYVGVVLVSSFVVLSLHGTPLELAATGVAICVTRLAWTWWDTRMVAPRVRPGLAAARLSTVRLLLPHSVERALGNVATVLSQQGTLLAISATLGPTAAATLSTSRTLVNFSRLSSNMMSNAVYTEFADLYVREDHVMGARLLRVVASGAVGLTFPILAVLLMFGPEIYAGWMHGRLNTQTGLLNLLILEALALVPIYMIRTVLLASNQHRLSVWVESGSIACAVGLTFVGAGYLGMLAAPLSVLVLQVPLFGVVVVKEVRRVLGQWWRLRMLVWVCLKAIGLIVGSCAWCWVAGVVFVDVWIRAGIGLAGSECIGLLVWWWMLDRADRTALWDRALRTVPLLRTVGGGGRS